MHLRCLVHGHQNLWHWEPGHIFLRCGECGRETPGWTLDLPTPRRRFAHIAHAIGCSDSITARPLETGGR